MQDQTMRSTALAAAALVTLPAAAGVPLQFEQLFRLNDAPIVNRPGAVVSPLDADPNRWLQFFAATDGREVSFVAGASDEQTITAHYTWSPETGIIANTSISVTLPGPDGTPQPVPTASSRHRVDNGREVFAAGTSIYALFADLGAGPEPVAITRQPIGPAEPDRTYGSIGIGDFDGDTLFFPYVGSGRGVRDGQRIARMSPTGTIDIIAREGDPAVDVQGNADEPLDMPGSPRGFSVAAEAGTVLFKEGFSGRNLVMHKGGVNTRLPIFAGIGFTDLAFDGRRVLVAEGQDSQLYDTITNTTLAIGDAEFPISPTSRFTNPALDDGKVIYLSETADFLGLVLLENNTRTPLVNFLEDTEIAGVEIPQLMFDSLFSIQSFDNDTLVFEGVASDGFSYVYRLTIPTPGSAALLTIAGLAAARRRR